MKFRLIEEEKSHHTISRLARVLGVTAAGYHAWKNRPTSRRVTEDERLKKLNQAAHERSYGIYVPTWEGWLFLAVVVDACSRRVCGWSMRDDLKADLVVDALGMATTRRRPGPGLIHHSDSEYMGAGFLRVA